MMDVNRFQRAMQIGTITIEEDGWVWVSTKDGKHDMGLGDLDVDVRLIDKRKVYEPN